MAPSDEVSEALDEDRPPDWDEIVCGMCPAFERFAFDEKCEGGCAKPHESVRGLCRAKLPERDHDGSDRGRWCVVNVDDWCIPGRDMVMDAIHGAPPEDPP